MADTLEQIYINTSLGATQLNDGEHTLLTTDANTSYVIKDMNVSNTSTFIGTHLELNGFNVGSLAGNATGSLIVPPSSTLKIKTTDYPLKVYERRTAMSLNTNGTVVQKDFFNASGTSIGTSKIGYTGNSTSLNNQIGDIDVFDSSSNTYVAYTTSDGNSSQQVKQVLSQAYNQSASATTATSGNYVPFGLFNHPTYGYISVNFTGSSLQYVTLGDSVAATTPSSWNNGSITNGSYEPTSSSYPQAYCDHNYFWYSRNVGLDIYFYGINMTTGVQLRFIMSTPAIDAERPFVIAYRPVDDKFILYHHHNGTNFAVKIFAKTRTQLNAVTANTNYSNADSFSSEDTHAFQNTVSNGYHASARQFSYDKDGNMGFQDTNSHIRFQKPDGSSLGASRDVEDITFIDGQTHSSDNRVFFQRYKEMTPTEISAQGITSSTFGIQLLGVKTETS